MPTSCLVLGLKIAGNWRPFEGSKYRKETEKAGFVRSKSTDEGQTEGAFTQKEQGDGEGREAPRGGGGDSWPNYLVAMEFLLPAPGSGEARVFHLPWGLAISCSLVTSLPVSQKKLLFFCTKHPPINILMVFNPCGV